MTTYAISYDLHKKDGFDYTNLIDAIKAYPNWCHHLESDWVVTSDKTAEQIRDDLLRHIHKDDKLIVFKLAREAAWYGLSDKISDWLKNNL